MSGTLAAAMTTIDPTVPDTFLQIADDLDALAGAARRTFADPLWTDDSEARQEVAQEATFADTWSQRPVQYVLHMAAITIMMAEEHLVAMAAATRAEHTVFAPLTKGRWRSMSASVRCLAARRCAGQTVEDVDVWEDVRAHVGDRQI
jgi:hypothetical protein